jgi:hypothetical protein
MLKTSLESIFSQGPDNPTRGQACNSAIPGCAKMLDEEARRESREPLSEGRMRIAELQA